MNLHRFKRGFSRTNPEKGLRSLPGAQKAERHENAGQTVRVKGTYIPSNTDKFGDFLGMTGYIHAWIYVILLPCTIFAGPTTDFTPAVVFVIGFAIVHGCAVFADGIRHSEAPWARKGIKIFWITTLVWGLCGVIYSLV